MLKEIEEAFSQKDYQKAEFLLDQLKEKEGKNPWFQYYQARLEESKNKLEQAEQYYLKILRDNIHLNLQLSSKIRNGINRIKAIKNEQKEMALKTFQEIPDSEEWGVLILAPMAVEEKKEAAQKMAKILETDVYSARLLIPSRSLKFYRSGKLGELKYYESQLNEASIPNFCFSFKEINNVSVYQVKYIESLSPKLILVCEDNRQQEKKINIQWTDIKTRIEALLPLFESSVHVGRQGKLERKITTLDYVQFCDLHLKNNNIILRFNDYNYQFNQGVNFGDKENTIKTKWAKLCQLFQAEIPSIPVWSDFTLFGEGLMQFSEMLKQINSQVKLFRREETPWDAAFQLYSAVIFLKTV